MNIKVKERETGKESVFEIESEELDAIIRCIFDVWNQGECSPGLKGYLRGMERILQLKDVCYFTLGTTKKVIAIIDENTRYITDYTLSELEKMLGRYMFARASRNTIINLNKVDGLDQYAGHTEVLFKNKHLPNINVSRLYVKNLKSLIYM